MKRKKKHFPTKEIKPNKLRFILKKLITDAGLGDIRLSRMLGIPHSTLHQILNSDEISPRVETLRPIAKYFLIIIDQLLGDQPIAGFSMDNDKKRSIKKGSRQWNPELYVECVLMVCNLLKKEVYKDKFSAEEALDTIKEIYFYFLLQYTKKADLKFIIINLLKIYSAKGSTIVAPLIF